MSSGAELMRLEENVLFEDKVSSIVQAPHLKEIKIKGGKNEVGNHSDLPNEFDFDFQSLHVCRTSPLQYTLFSRSFRNFQTYFYFIFVDFHYNLVST